MYFLPPQTVGQTADPQDYNLFANNPNAQALMVAVGGFLGLVGAYADILTTRALGPRFVGSVDREIAKKHAPLFLINSTITGAAMAATISYVPTDPDDNLLVRNLKSLLVMFSAAAIVGLPMWVTMYNIWKKQGKKKSRNKK